jgi:muconolactone delta-isomerase
MLLLVEMDHAWPGEPPTAEAGRAFVERIIFPTIARAEELFSRGTIVAGGPVAGRVALRLVIEAESLEHADRIVSGLPLWTVAETRITPLVSFSERRSHVQALLERVNAGAERRPA